MVVKESISKLRLPESNLRDDYLSKENMGRRSLDTRLGVLLLVKFPPHQNLELLKIKY